MPNTTVMNLQGNTIEDLYDTKRALPNAAEQRDRTERTVR
jgi:hypothetical protein